MTVETIASSVSGKRAVVFGGAGFVGSHLVERLIDAGASVIAVDNEVTGRWSNLAGVGDPASLRTIRHDVTHPLSVDGPVDFVLNFASPASPPKYRELPIETLRAGSIGTENSLELAMAKSARFLLASTSEVYGEPTEHPQKESYWGYVNPIGPRSMYDEAKRYAEAVTTAYRNHRGVDTTIARVFNTYGPRMRPDDGRAVPAFIGAALRNEPLPIHGDGQQTRSLCFVSDLVDGLLLLLTSEHPGPVNIGNPEEVTIRELAEEIVDQSGSRSGFEFGPRPQDDPSRRCPDISIAQRELGWAPAIGLRSGLKKTIAWFDELEDSTQTG